MFDTARNVTHCIEPGDRLSKTDDTPSTANALRSRTPYLSLADAAATCRETAHLAPDVPALTPFRPYAPPAPSKASGPVAAPRPITE